MSLSFVPFIRGIIEAFYVNSLLVQLGLLLLQTTQLLEVVLVAISAVHVFKISYTFSFLLEMEYKIQYLVLMHELRKRLNSGVINAYVKK
jgi:hypothetical protein